MHAPSMSPPSAPQQYSEFFKFYWITVKSWCFEEKRSAYQHRAQIQAAAAYAAAATPAAADHGGTSVSSTDIHIVDNDICPQFFVQFHGFHVLTPPLRVPIMHL